MKALEWKREGETYVAENGFREFRVGPSDDAATVYVISVNGEYFDFEHTLELAQERANCEAQQDD